MSAILDTLRTAAQRVRCGDTHATFIDTVSHELREPMQVLFLILPEAEQLTTQDRAAINRSLARLKEVADAMIQMLDSDFSLESMSLRARPCQSGACQATISAEDLSVLKELFIHLGLVFKGAICSEVKARAARHIVALDNAMEALKSRQEVRG